MKICTKCKQEKPRDEFYRARGSKSGLHSWCKVCVKAHSSHRETGAPPIARSTAMAMALLETKGIWTKPGSAYGHNYVDLMAFSVIPIEAKLSTQVGGKDKFQWTFTGGQLKKLNGYIMFIADYGDRQRVFIVPRQSELMMAKAELSNGKGQSVCVTLDCNRPNSNWATFKRYENRYDWLMLAA